MKQLDPNMVIRCMDEGSSYAAAVKWRERTPKDYMDQNPYHPSSAEGVAWRAGYFERVATEYYGLFIGTRNAYHNLKEEYDL